ncbi:MAG: acyl-CoA synthetase [Paracoccaceae bacterium]|nr:acyl-CoA synthetase [Paracoccaceae bacterium]MDE2917810.1 acyl-CoA synthetase [Paracoccaceae bacterium]
MFNDLAGKKSIEQGMPWDDVENPTTIFEALNITKNGYGTKSAISFQIEADPKSHAETLTWNDVYRRVCQTANFFNSLGVGRDDVVAFLLPNCNETIFTLLGGMIAGKVNPINPLLSASQIAGILNSSNAKVLVTLKSFPKTNVAQLAHEAAAECTDIKHIVEIDLVRYLKPPKKWIAGLIRPKATHPSGILIHDFYEGIDKQNGNGLDFDDSQEDRIAALFHTGGTTGLPKLAQHKQSGMIYNGWCGKLIGITSDEVIICPLPLFHVFAAYPILMSGIRTGAHIVFPTPAGYRGDKVFDLFWDLVERWQVTFMITVPTALSVLMQKPIKADISSLRSAICGSAPLPTELFNRFEKATGVNIMEGYGLTETTCIVSVNPPDGVKKIGSVGLPFPYTDVRILDCDDQGQIIKECDTDEIGEICISAPGVFVGNTYTDSEKNIGLYSDENWVRTGDLGKIDEDGYVWITGRAKDQIIRGGHNIDPAIIEENLAGHDSVAFVGAIGQPDTKMGELPCVYVELIEGTTTTSDELLNYAKENITNKLAMPVHVEVVGALPKTAVGKVFKPDLRIMAINRVLSERFNDEGIQIEISTSEVPKKGLVTNVSGNFDDVQRERVQAILNEYPISWMFAQIQ